MPTMDGCTKCGEPALAAAVTRFAAISASPLVPVAQLMITPAPRTAASMPSPWRRSPAKNLTCGSVPRWRRASTRTSWPASISRVTTDRPSRPVPPVTRTGDVMGSPHLQPGPSSAPFFYDARPRRSVTGTADEQPAALAQAGQEADQAGEVGLLVVVHGHVAAVGAVKVLTGRELARHHLHVRGVHAVVAGTDDQRGHGYRAEIGKPVPVVQARVGADAQLARSLHGDVDRRVDVI